MKVFVYGFHKGEKQYFESSAKEYEIAYEACHEAPSLENAHLAQGYPCISMLSTPCPKELIEKFYEIGVRFISTRTAGYDHIDIEAAKQIGMHIGNATYASESVADYAIMLVLMALRKMKLIMKSAALQEYSFSKVEGRNLKGKTVGVIGTGNIGKTFIRHIHGFDCTILAYSTHPSNEMKPYVTYTDFETVLKHSDILSLHVPLHEKTYHMLNKEAFSIMKEGVIIINTARGGLIDNEALIESLEQGKVGGAALDVVEGETGIYYYNRKGDVLTQRNMAILEAFPNVILSPHMAFLTDDSNRDMVLNSMKSCYAFMEAEENPWIVV